MPNALAPTTFSAGTRDDLAAGDVYTRTDPGVINRTPNVLSAPSADVIGTLRGGTSAMSLLPVGVQPGGLPKAIPSSFSGASSMMGKGLPGLPSLPRIPGIPALRGGLPTSGGLIGSLSNMASGALAQMDNKLGPAAAKALKLVTPKIAAAVTQKINAKMPGMGGALATGNLGSVVSVSGINNRIPINNVVNVNSLLSAVSSVSGAPAASVVNQGGLAKMVGGLVGQGSANQVSGLFTQMWPKLTSEAQVTQAVSTALPDVISHSDLNTLKEMSSLTSVVPKVNSSVLNDFSANYKPKAPMSGPDCVGVFSDIKTTFGTIDPGWFNVKKEIGNSGAIEDAVNLTIPMNATPEFQRAVSVGAMASPNPEDKLFLLADKIPLLSADDILKNTYPLAAAQPESTLVESATDVRMVSKEMPPPAAPNWVEFSRASVIKYDANNQQYYEVVVKCRNEKGMIMKRTTKEYGGVQVGDAIVSISPS